MEQTILAKSFSEHSKVIFPIACKVAKRKLIFVKEIRQTLLSRRHYCYFHVQLSTFPSENKTLHNYQSGLRLNQLTSLCLPSLTNGVLKGSNKVLLTRRIIMDLQTAFGIINHKVFRGKLKAFRFSLQRIQLLALYLSERLIYVNTDNKLPNF